MHSLKPMKKIFITIFLALFVPLAFASANVDEDTWSYFFHLQYKQGVLAVEEGRAQPYTPVPELYTEKTDPRATDFYGIIVSGRGSELARFGFDKPESVIVAQGKSVFTVKAPLFANADHVSFYARGGKKLFDVSTKSSSFCNDNNKCESEVGENYRNCPIDCPAPPNTSPPQTPPAPPTVVTPPSTATTASETVTPPQKNPGATGIMTGESGTTPTSGASKKVIIILTAFGTLALILAGVMWKVRKNLN